RRASSWRPATTSKYVATMWPFCACWMQRAFSSMPPDGGASLRCSRRASRTGECGIVIEHLALYRCEPRVFAGNPEREPSNCHRSPVMLHRIVSTLIVALLLAGMASLGPVPTAAAQDDKIGRASCRERVAVSVRGGG